MNSESLQTSVAAADATAASTPRTTADSSTTSVTMPQPQPQPQQQSSSASTSAAATAATETVRAPAISSSSDKVKVHFVAVGSAPILKKTKFQIAANQRFAAVTAFLRKMLKLHDDNNDNTGQSQALFLYCHSAFVPGPDELVGDLRDCFSVRDELVIHYSLQEAWG